MELDLLRQADAALVNTVINIGRTRDEPHTTKSLAQAEISHKDENVTHNIVVALWVIL